MNGLVSPAAIVPLLPWLAAAALALLPAWRIAALANSAAAAATFLAACLLAGRPPAPSAFLLADRLSLHLVLLTSFIGLTTSFVSFSYVQHEVAAGRLDPPRLRLYHATYQALLGGMLLALLSNNVGLTWAAAAAATLAGLLAVALPGTVGAIAASWKMFTICGLGLALAGFGTVGLYLAAAPGLGPGLGAMSWTGLLAGAARCDGPTLDLAFVFLLLGYATIAGLAPLHSWLPDARAAGPAPVSAVLAGSMSTVGLMVILRLRTLLAGNPQAIAPGPPIMAVGLLSLLFAAFSLWRRRDARRFFALSAIGQGGVAAYAFGLGGPAATFAGLLHLTVHALLKASVLQCVGGAAQRKGGQGFGQLGGLLGSRAGLGVVLAAGIVGLAGLPPFGLFPSEFLIAAATLGQAPLLALPLLIGLVVGAWALLARLPGLWLGPPTPGTAGVTWPAAIVLPAGSQLVLAAWLAFAMPGAVVAWFAAIAGSGG